MATVEIKDQEEQRLASTKIEETNKENGGRQHRSHKNRRNSGGGGSNSDDKNEESTKRGENKRKKSFRKRKLQVSRVSLKDQEDSCDANDPGEKKEHSEKIFPQSDSNCTVVSPSAGVVDSVKKNQIKETNEKEVPENNKIKSRTENEKQASRNESTRTGDELVDCKKSFEHNGKNSKIDKSKRSRGTRTRQKSLNLNFGSRKESNFRIPLDSESSLSTETELRPQSHQKSNTPEETREESNPTTKKTLLIGTHVSRKDLKDEPTEKKILEDALSAKIDRIFYDAKDGHEEKKERKGHFSFFFCIFS